MKQHEKKLSEIFVPKKFPGLVIFSKNVKTFSSWTLPSKCFTALNTAPIQMKFSIQLLWIYINNRSEPDF